MWRSACAGGCVVRGSCSCSARPERWHDRKGIATCGRADHRGGRGVCPSRRGLIWGYHTVTEHQGRLRRRCAMAAPPLTPGARVIETPQATPRGTDTTTDQAIAQIRRSRPGGAEGHPLAAGAGRPKGWARHRPISRSTAATRRRPSRRPGWVTSPPATLQRRSQLPMGGLPQLRTFGQQPGRVAFGGAACECRRRRDRVMGGLVRPRRHRGHGAAQSGRSNPESPAACSGRASWAGTRSPSPSLPGAVAGARIGASVDDWCSVTHDTAQL